MTPDETYLRSADVRARYGNASDMWLWRRLHDGSGFPRPLLINARRFWRLSELIAWEQTRNQNAANDTPEGDA